MKGKKIFYVETALHPLSAVCASISNLAEATLIINRT